MDSGRIVSTQYVSLEPDLHQLEMTIDKFFADTSDLEDESDSVCCRGCDEEKEECKCQQIIDAFHKLNRQL